MRFNNLLKTLKDNWLIIAIVIIGSLLRFWNYSSFSFTNDELSALNRIRFDTFSEMLAGGAWVDGHPAGVQIFIYLWVKLFGLSEIIVRFPFVIFGILSIVFAYKASKSWFGKGAGIFVASGVAFLSFTLLYSNLSRPYAPGLMFTMLLAWYWNKVLNENDISIREKIINTLIFIVAIVGAIYTHYFAALMTVISGFSGLFFINKKNYKYFISSYLVAALLFIPHINFTLNHLSLGGVEQWLAKPDGYWFFNHLFNFFNRDLLLIATILISLIIVIKKNKKINKNSLRFVALIWFLSPFVIGYSYSCIVNSVLQDSVLLFSTPFLLFIAGSIWSNNADQKERGLLVLVALMMLLSTLFTAKHFNKIHFADFKITANKIIEYEKYYGKENSIKMFNVNHPYYITYYLGDDTLGTANWSFQNEFDYLELKDIIKRDSNNFLIYSRLRSENSIVHDIIRSEYPYLIEHDDFDSCSEIFVYSREHTNVKIKDKAPQLLYGHGFEGQRRWEGELMRVDTISFKGALGLKIKPEDEYSPAWIASFDTLTFFRTISYIKVETYMLAETFNELQLVVSVEDNDNRLIYWGSSPAKYFINSNEWGKLIHTFNFNKPITKGMIIKSYIWNPSNEKAVIDDFSISFY